MENAYQYFKRDISWLSFNYRVLLEADDDSLPLYERINFIAIYSSNLEEFYKIRVADHKANVSGARTDEESIQSSLETLEEINKELNKQVEQRLRIYEQKILPALRKNNVIFYQSKDVEPFHEEFVRSFFKEEVFPFLQPVLISKGEIVSFLRDNRLYLAVRMFRKNCSVDNPSRVQYFVIKMPYSKAPRFVELPQHEGKYYLMYLEDIIKANIGTIFPGYDVDCCYNVKISRDADILIDDMASGSIVEQMKKKVKKRKIGAVCRFVYDRQMPNDFLNFLIDAFHINLNELVEGDSHLNLEDLCHLPNPNKLLRINEKPQPMRLNYLDRRSSIFQYVRKRDLMVHYPYHTFEHLIHFLYEAVHDPLTKEIMITQYRAAENSAVINTLISAAQNGKKVTVFVELKARFDEENNLETAELMHKAGINIIYSIPGLKVHAKVALILRQSDKHMDRHVHSYAYISTGNFNEKTAKVYSDIGVFTSNSEIVEDLHTLFLILEKKVEKPLFKHLLVAQFNLIPELTKLINHEIELARQGRKGKIILKMNALQDQSMIDELYRASENGVEIELIVRGICCLIPGQPYSKNIRVTRIVDSFLEHSRVWYFNNDGNPKVYIGSPDWMRRNLYRRIEAVTPILNEELKQEIIDILNIQLKDNQKACFVEANLQNRFKYNPSEPPVRAQYAIYNFLKDKNSLPLRPN